jgi:hypothetical protein
MPFDALTILTRALLTPLVQLLRHRLCWDARDLTFLRGGAPLRRLSQSLIIILMLISPLSFSSDTITNFTYECPVSAACTIKDSRRADVSNRTALEPQHDAALSAAHHALPVSLRPPLPKLSFNAPSRAPPA